MQHSPATSSFGAAANGADVLPSGQGSHRTSNKASPARHIPLLSPLNGAVGNASKPHFGENDIGSWFVDEDISFEESEGEAKATSLHVPSSVCRKNSLDHEGKAHKSVEVLMGSDEQQAAKDTNKTVEIGKVDALVERKPENANTSQSSESEWDSTDEEEADKPYGCQNPPPLDGTLGRIDTLQGTEEIWEKNPSLPEKTMGSPTSNLKSDHHQIVSLAVSEDQGNMTQLEQDLRDGLAVDGDTPQRPPRLSKNRLRSSWSSSSSSSAMSRSCPLGVGNLRRQSLGARKENGCPQPHQESMDQQVSEKAVSTLKRLSEVSLSESREQQDMSPKYVNHASC